MKGLENNYTCMICLILRPQLQNSTGNNCYREIVGPGFRFPSVFLSNFCLLVVFFSKLLYCFAFKLNQSQSNESSMMHLNILPEQYTVFGFDSNPLFGVNMIYVKQYILYSLKNFFL